jgi:hypothetical protein
MRRLFVLWVACRSPDDGCPRDGRALTCDDRLALTCQDGRIEDRELCADDQVCVEGTGCSSCDPGLPAGPLGVPVDPTPVQSGEAWRTLAWTPVDLRGAGPAELVSTGPIEFYDGTANRISTVELPTTVFVRAIGGGEVGLSVRMSGCPNAARVSLTALPFPGLSAIELASSPDATHVDAFLAGGTLRIAVDPMRVPELVGSSGAVWVVPDRDRDAWLADPVLVDAAHGPVPFSPAGTGLAGTSTAIWADLPEPVGGRASYDLVWDVDADGTLSVGDRIDGLDGPGFVIYGDLGAPGRFTPVVAEVSTSFFLTQRVWWPAELPDFGEPAPLVVISHGNGHEYTWYDYLGSHLASHGYVVMSHRNNTAPGVESAATSTLSNTDAFVRTHALIDPALDGRVDVHRIAWIGHSRGGEGVVIAWDRLVRGEANVQDLEPDDIALISSIAPTVFLDPTVSNPGDRPFHMLAGSADGDIVGAVADPLFGVPCPSCQWWRLRQGARSLQAVTYLHGAAHNDFVEHGFDDGSAVDAPRFGKTAVQEHTRATYVVLLDHVLRGDEVAGEFLRRLPDELALPKPAGSPIVTQYRAYPSRSRVIEDFQQNDDPAVSSSGTAVRHTMTDYLEGRLDDGNATFAWHGDDPMNGMIESDQDDPLIAARGAVFGWDGGGNWEVDLPEDARDLTTSRFLTLRVAQQTRHPNTVALDDALTFGVGLVDHSGREVVLRTDAHGGIPAPYPRPGLGSGAGWANEFQTVTLRLTDFEVDHFDLSDVRTVRLRFGSAWGSPIGRIGLDDLALED